MWPRRSSSSTRASFETEVMPHLDAMYGMALRLTRDASDAEDLVQDAMLRAFRFFDRFQEGTNCKAWLFKILTNTFINKYRKKVREAEVVSGAEAEALEKAMPPEESPVPDDPERALLRKMLGERIQEALDHVPVDFRMVVILADMEEFTYREIAEIMDCPIGTVMSRLYRGRRQLQARLRDYAMREGLLKGAAAEPVGTREVARDNVAHLEDYRRKRTNTP